MTSQSEAHYGRGVDALFKGASQIVAPFPRAGRRKDVHDVDPEVVAKAIKAGVTQKVDPRTLHVSQPNVTLEGVQHYASGKGGLYADAHKVGNRTPIVYRRGGVNILLSGTHRATAALVKGEHLDAIVAEGGWGPPRRK